MVKKQLIAARIKSRTDQSSELLSLDASRIIAGIMFHLADEEIAMSIERDSIKRTLQRFQQSGMTLRIARGGWAEMSGEQRLTWLLVESQTCVVLANGVATLSRLQTTPNCHQ